MYNDLLVYPKICNTKPPNTSFATVSFVEDACHVLEKKAVSWKRSTTEDVVMCLESLVLLFYPNPFWEGLLR